MKITCSHCQAKYQVNLPSIGDAGVDVKCARCQKTFRVYQETPSAVGAGNRGGGTLDRDSQSSPSPAAEPPGEDAADSGGDMDEDLDALLDDLIEKEISGQGEIPPPVAEDAAEDAGDLDELLDDLITESEPSPTQEDPAESLKKGISETETADPSLDEAALDAIWEEAVEEGQQETSQEAAEPVTETAPPAEVAEPPAEQADEDLLSQAFADETAVETEPSAEAEPPAEAAEAPAGQSEEDLWAQAFADQSAAESEPSAETEPPAEAAEAPAGKPESSEEDLWAQAFGEAEKEESAETAEAEAGDAEEEDAATGLEDIPEEELQDLASLKEEDSEGLGLADEALAGYREEDYADVDEKEYEYEGSRKKLGPIPLPATKTGKLVLGGSILALALVGGSAYFAIQTFAPPELIEEGKTASAPETKPVKPPAAETPKAKSPAETKPAPAAAPEPAAAPNAMEKAQKQLLDKGPDAGSSKPGAPTALGEALQPFAAVVEMNTIMPVAYNATDIKVLSFTLQLELDTPAAAQGMRDSMPVYEKIMISTVEDFLKRKFYSDILYVKEKLGKRLELAINKGLKNGKVSKAKFKNFQIG